MQDFIFSNEFYKNRVSEKIGGIGLVAEFGMSKKKYGKQKRSPVGWKSLTRDEQSIQTGDPYALYRLFFQYSSFFS
ncbi:hypothetical protein IM774_12595 [Erysipelotrichaceae bacterium RD49]|nr:hypothetical protein [Erysipelotrichaceae bacterium RD49]